MLKTPFLLLPLAVLLQSCGTAGAVTESPVIVDNGCKWARPIYVSKSDKLTDWNSPLNLRTRRLS